MTAGHLKYNRERTGFLKARLCTPEQILVPHVPPYGEVGGGGGGAFLPFLIGLSVPEDGSGGGKGPWVPGEGS